MPNIDFITISQKIEDKTKKDELIKCIKENLPEGFGAIVRTSAKKVSKEDIKKEDSRCIRYNGNPPIFY